MTIITLLDVETKKKVIVRSVIDPIARIDKKGNIQIIQIHKWLYDESGDFVDEDLYEALNNGEVGKRWSHLFEQLKAYL
ncbi:hypothetical protein [Acinetobacter baumannii]|uniref:Uncharacterized protein n=1 Tax=Acinetobacter baumannii TaxID=470 RepID=A0A5N5XUM5_ACIBA|nr:hypothetical protein [Acinetobacter baumannii]KAB8125629.1 hypothetical protein FDO31_20460 [Acinetobacter baumannii]MQQ74285.1 hypothetical protein [Acinetobacter baumannii]MQQ85461.1 hypothetical protein [Acinetobacter baumannii]MQQ89372.1 hypothetical protein [Acinetobacter baumannii]MQR16600.1 hypothetical protein [Acinetobacter baumannii]